MKRKIFCIIFALIAACFSWYSSKNVDGVLGDLLVDNIEALAFGEGSWDQCNNQCQWDTRFNCAVYYAGVPYFFCNCFRPR